MNNIILALTVFLGLSPQAPATPAAHDAFTTASLPEITTGQSPAGLSAVPEQYLQRKYPGLKQSWNLLAGEAETQMYRVRLRDEAGQLQAEGIYCLSEIADGKAWKHQFSLFKAIPSTQPDDPIAGLTDQALHERIQNVLVEKHQDKPFNGPVNFYRFEMHNFVSYRKGEDLLKVYLQSISEGYALIGSEEVHGFDLKGTEVAWPMYWAALPR